MEEKKYTVDDWKQPGFNELDDYPAVFVFWHNAVDFCNWMSEKEGKQYRLPTEAEWEYCCRAGTSGTRYCFGDADDQLENYAWYHKNSGVAGVSGDVRKPNPGGRMHPVGKLKPNAWGLHDMHGNAWEWCQDNYDPDYYKRSRRNDPFAVDGGDRGGTHWSSRDHGLRGGSCHWSPVFCRSAFRHNLAPTDRYEDVGFRVLLVPAPVGAGKVGDK
jgi:formylglycine-generating enzyme required for sulfatase activity